MSDSFETPWTIACQAPLPIGFPRQEYWSGLPFPSPYRKWSHSVVSNSLRPHGLYTTRLLRPWNFLGKSTGVGCHFLLQEIFPTQGSNQGLLHCGQMLYCLSHQGISPYMQSTWCEMPDWMKSQARIKIARINIYNLRYEDDTTLMARSNKDETGEWKC